MNLTKISASFFFFSRHGRVKLFEYGWLNHFFSSYSHSDDQDKRYFLRRIGLNEEEITWPEKVSDDSVRANYWDKNPHSTKGMYGPSDLSKVPIFKGGYINFGCWGNLKGTASDDSTRAKASELMYKEMAETANLNKESQVVDVGCGIGYGCQYIMRRYNPKTLVGLDITPQQIERAKKNCVEKTQTYIQDV